MCCVGAVVCCVGAVVCCMGAVVCCLGAVAWSLAAVECHEVTSPVRVVVISRGSRMKCAPVLCCSSSLRKATIMMRLAVNTPAMQRRTVRGKR